MSVTISIIVPTQRYTSEIQTQLMPALKAQVFTDFECIFVSPDIYKHKKPAWLKTIICSEKLKPGQMRDSAAKSARGNLLAFIDADAFPDSKWLKQIIGRFKQDSEAAAIGGTNLVPIDVDWRESLSGLFWQSLTGSGNLSFRNKKADTNNVTDHVSSNLSIRKSSFELVGGFNTHYWPGEDTYLCRKLMLRNQKIVHDPEVIVFHHRRPVLLPHLVQIIRFGSQRGLFFRIYPENSRKAIYLVPLVFIVVLLYALALDRPTAIALFTAYMLGIGVEALMISIKHQAWYPALLIIVTPLSHFSYAVAFLWGLLFRGWTGRLIQ